MSQVLLRGLARIALGSTIVASVAFGGHAVAGSTPGTPPATVTATVETTTAGTSGNSIDTIYLSDIAWSTAENGLGPIERDTNNGKRRAGDGGPIVLDGVTYAKGLGVFSPSVVAYDLGGLCQMLQVRVGIDDAAGPKASVEFEVWGDERRLYWSGSMGPDSSSLMVNVALDGVQELRLAVTDGGDRAQHDLADWADAKVVCIAASSASSGTTTTTPPTSTSTTPTTAASSSTTSTTSAATTTTTAATSTTSASTTTTTAATSTTSASTTTTTAATTTTTAATTTTTTARVRTYGSVSFWTAENEASTHSPSRAQAVEDAKVFDVITALQKSYRDHVAAMKAANPSLTLLAYMNGTFAQKSQGTAYSEGWYLRDAGGAKVRSNGYGNYLMNPSSPGWIQDRVQTCKNLIKNSGYDGCMLDMLGIAPLWPGYATGLPINPATGAVWTKAEWLAATNKLARAVKDAVGPNKVYGNGLGSGQRYFGSGARTLMDGIDGGIAEMFVRTATQGVTSYRNEAAWKKDVDMLVDAEARGRRLLAYSKLWVSATTAQRNAWHTYAYASFLLGTNGSSYFAFSGKRGEDPTLGYPLWDTSIGRPQGSYEKTDGIYWRTFTGGKVLVNPSGETRSIDLGGTYKTPEGSTVTSVRLNPHTAVLLLKP